LLITSFGPEFPSLVFLSLLTDLHIGAVISVPLDPAVDVKIERGQKAIGFSFMEDLHPIEVVIMVKQKDMLSDQGDGGLVELAIEGDGAVFGNSSPCVLAKITLEVRGGRSEAFHLSGEALKRALVGGAVFSLMVDVL
jgi:hypothetical protein